MKTGVSYMGHHNPKHIQVDILEMRRLQLDEVLVAAQENDFVYFTGKVEFTPKIAKDNGMTPIALFWGLLNCFGGGKSSQFLLQHPEGFQVAIDGSHRAHGCYMNPLCLREIQRLIDRIAELGYEGYFVDEPTPMRECFCASCQGKFQEWYQQDLTQAPPELREQFRQRCVIHYVQSISGYCKKNHPSLRTMCCLMPHDKSLWDEAARIESLDELSTDIYWVNNDNDVEEMRPLVQELDSLCKTHGKIHQEWLQCWNVAEGKEQRIVDQGRILIQEQPQALYVWAWLGQVGISETCADPEASWAKTCEVFRLAKE